MLNLINKMKTNKLFCKFIVTIFLILLFSACDKRVDMNVDEETYAYCNFYGGYWIYQDSETLKTDSVVYTSCDFKQSSYKTKKGTLYYSEYTMNTENYIFNNFHYDGSYILTGKHCDYNNVKKGISKPILVKYQRGIDEYKYIAIASISIKYHNGDLYENYEDLLYENYYDYYRIGDNIFSKVKVFLYSFPNQQYKIRTYWAVNIGIIRTEYIKEDKNIFAVRNLIEYKVEQ